MGGGRAALAHAGVAEAARAGGGRSARARAPVGARVPARWAPAGHRAARAPAHRRPGGTLSAPLSGMPAVYARGQGGLLDVALSPTFAQDRLVYLSSPSPGRAARGTAVARGRLGPRRASRTPQVIFRQQPKVQGPNHWGSRLVFRPTARFRHARRALRATATSAQDPGDDLGKIVRINPDGSIPKDNPFVGRRGRAARRSGPRPSQRAGRGARSGDRPAVDG